MSIVFSNDISTASFICEVPPFVFMFYGFFFLSGLCITWTDDVTFMKLAVGLVSRGEWEAGMA
jgi:uncharacterized membrane protein YkgB